MNYDLHAVRDCNSISIESSVYLIHNPERHKDIRFVFLVLITEVKIEMQQPFVDLHTDLLLVSCFYTPFQSYQYQQYYPMVEGIFVSSYENKQHSF